jgi:hypothetical protein
VRQRGAGRSGATKYPYWVAKEGERSEAQQARAKRYSPEEQQALKVRATEALGVLREPLYQQGVGESAEFTDRLKAVEAAIANANDKDDFVALEAALRQYKNLDLY